jgi:hypothetical protein
MDGLRVDGSMADVSLNGLVDGCINELNRLIDPRQI